MILKALTAVSEAGTFCNNSLKLERIMINDLGLPRLHIAHLIFVTFHLAELLLVIDYILGRRSHEEPPKDDNVHAYHIRPIPGSSVPKALSSRRVA